MGLVAAACQSSGGPPFVWVCTPANYDFGNNGAAEINIFIGSATTANVAAHFLAKNGANLAGLSIPATSPVVTYLGQTGNATVAVASLNPLIKNSGLFECRFAGSATSPGVPIAQHRALRDEHSRGVTGRRAPQSSPGHATCVADMRMATDYRSYPTTDLLENQNFAGSSWCAFLPCALGSSCIDEGSRCMFRRSPKSRHLACERSGEGGGL